MASVTYGLGRLVIDETEHSIGSAEKVGSHIVAIV